jgi:predicted DNA-binding antitoxin AbrB/MazE fold protein
MVTTIKAIYEDGVLKPLEPLDLKDKEIVEIRVAKKTGDAPVIANLDGIWSQYVVGSSLSYEEIDDITKEKHGQSLDRLLRQVSGDFDEEDSGA